MGDGTDARAVGRAARRSAIGHVENAGMKILRCWWLIAKRGARADPVLVTTPTLDNDLGFSQHLEYLAIERLTAKTNSLTPI